MAKKCRWPAQITRGSECLAEILFYIMMMRDYYNSNVSIEDKMIESNYETLQTH